MPRKANSTPEEIYNDYIVTLVKNGKINDIHKKHGVSRKYVDLVRKRAESKMKYNVAKNLRKQNWEFKYKNIQDKLNSKKKWTKEDKELQHALVRHLFMCHYNDTEIATFTGLSLQAVKIILWG